MTASAAPLPPPTDPLAAGFSTTAAGHRLTVLATGRERLDAVLGVIGSARERLQLLFYMLLPDATGTEVRDALAAASQRGVRVTLIVDRFGSSATPDAFFDPLRAAGATVAVFARRWRSSYLIRNHQKLLVADASVLVTGGFNLGDDYTDRSDDPWRDLGLVVEGPEVPRVAAWLDRMHAHVARHDGNIAHAMRIVRGWRGGDGAFAFLVGGPTPRLAPWAVTLRRDLWRARRVDMAMAYFAPSRGMLRRLKRVAWRGGAVRLVLPARSDNAATIGAARLLYGGLLRRGVELHEYDAAKLHTKLIVVDDVTWIGSANLDMRSLFINLEGVLRIEDAAFAERMRAFVGAHLAGSTRITPALHRARAGWFTRLRWTLAWLVVGVVDYGVARRLNFGLDRP